MAIASKRTARDSAGPEGNVWTFGTYDPWSNSAERASPPGRP